MGETVMRTKNLHINFILVSILLLFVTACNPVRPWPAGLVKEMSKDSPPEYQQGWKDGCESGLAAYGNDYYKTFYKFHYDEILMEKSKLYARIWQNSFKHCRSFVNRLLVEGWGWTEGWEGSNESGVFNSGSVRNTLSIERGASLPLIFKGLNTPGWGETGWGGGVSKGDWLGREPEYRPTYNSIW